jgi:hypothetical protein
MNSRLVPLVAAVIAFLGFSATTASAQWCARMQGAETCGFATLSQCRATVSGVGGGCFPSPGASNFRAGPGFVVPRRERAERAEQAQNWRKTVQERRRARAKELAREQQHRPPPVVSRPAAPPVVSRQTAAPTAAPAGTGRVAGVPLADLDVNAVPNLSRDGVRRVQIVLKEKGFDPGPTNGVAGARLKEAVRTFQAHYGIAARGEIDNQTLLALGEGELASQSNR